VQDKKETRKSYAKIFCKPEQLSKYSLKLRGTENAWEFSERRSSRELYAQQLLQCLAGAKAKLLLFAMRCNRAIHSVSSFLAEQATSAESSLSDS